VIPRSFDLFEAWRFVLAVACSVYAVIVTLRWIHGWVEYLYAPDRGRATLRRYAVVQLLRVRARRFLGESLQIGAWSILLVWLLSRHAT
jgi:hypothetical protein